MKPVCICIGLLLSYAGMAGAQTTVALSAQPPVSVYGRAVALTAVVSAPANASGKVTFYQESRLLGTQPVVNGQATLVTAQIQAGRHAIKVYYSGDSAHGAAVSPVVTETVAALAGQGFPTITTFASSTPVWAASGDFNMDGREDLAVIDPDYLYIYLGNGNGTFGTPIVYGAGGFASCVAVGDFNGDGHPDLVVINNNVSNNTGVGFVFLGNGNGSFQPPSSSFPVELGAIDIVVADFNLDGKADLAIANSGTMENVSVLLGNGNGTFAPLLAIATSASSNGANAIAVGDFNGDGVPDIAVAETNLVILTGTGGGTFYVSSTTQVGPNPSTSALADVQVADFNGDGIPDVAVPDFINGSVSIFLGSSGGGFQPQIILSSFFSPYFVSTGDFNGDGIQDLAVLDLGDYVSNPPNVSILVGLGDGLFQPIVRYPAGIAPNMLAQGDFNGDGVADLAYPDAGDFETNPGSLSVLLGSSCAVSLSGSPLSLAYASTGGTSSYSFATANPTCGSQTFSTVPWVTAQPASGTGDYSVELSVQANPTGVARTGSLLVAGQTISVLQDATAQVFSDVPPAAYYFDAVNLLAARGITAGCAANEYCPTEDVTRAQMAIFIVRAVLGTDNFTYSATPLFSDVPAGSFGFQWIQKLAEMNITGGCSPGMYCPDQSITRAEMAVFIIRARYGANTNFSYFGTPVFSDVPTGSFGFGWIQRMAQDTITTGCAPGLYCPSNAVTRGDMAIFIMRGAFNELLPIPKPVITSVSPRTLTHGATGTFTVTGVNTAFVQGQTAIYGINGAVVDNITVTSPTTLTATITAPTVTLQQPMAFYVYGSPEAVFPNAIAVP